MRTLTAALLVLVACQPAGPALTETDRAEIETAIRVQAEGLVEAQNTLDTEGFMAAVDTGDMVWVNHQARFESSEQVAEIVASIFSDIDSMDSGWRELDVTVLSPDAALSHGIWWGAQTTGAEVVRYDTVYWTAVHERRDDGAWKITRVHQSWQSPTVEEAEQR